MTPVMRVRLVDHLGQGFRRKLIVKAARAFSRADEVLAPQKDRECGVFVTMNFSARLISPDFPGSAD